MLLQNALNLFEYSFWPLFCEECPLILLSEFRVIFSHLQLLYLSTDFHVLSLCLKSGLFGVLLIDDCSILFHLCFSCLSETLYNFALPFLAFLHDLLMGRHRASLEPGMGQDIN